MKNYKVSLASVLKITLILVFIWDSAAESFSEWNYPPSNVYRELSFIPIFFCALSSSSSLKMHKTPNIEKLSSNIWVDWNFIIQIWLCSSTKAKSYSLRQHPSSSILILFSITTSRKFCHFSKFSPEPAALWDFYWLTNLMMASFQRFSSKWFYC